MNPVPFSTQDHLRQRIIDLLDSQTVCIVGAAGRLSLAAQPARYRRQGLDLICLIPRWADLAVLLEDGAQAVALIQAGQPADLRWLQVQGAVRPAAIPSWADGLANGSAAASLEDLYQAWEIAPRRIDLFDKGLGWGWRETLEF